MQSTRATCKATPLQIAQLLKPFATCVWFVTAAAAVESRKHKQQRLLANRDLWAALRGLSANYTKAQMKNALLQLLMNEDADFTIKNPGEWAEEMAKRICDGMRSCTKAIRKSKDAHWVSVLQAGGPLDRHVKRKRIQAKAADDSAKKSAGAASSKAPGPQIGEEEEVAETTLDTAEEENEESEEEESAGDDEEEAAFVEAPAAKLSKPGCDYMYGYCLQWDLPWRAKVQPSGTTGKKEYTSDIASFDPGVDGTPKVASARWQDGHEAKIVALTKEVWESRRDSKQSAMKSAMKRPAAANPPAPSPPAAELNEEQQSLSESIQVKFKKQHMRNSIWQILVDGCAKCQINAQHFGQTHDDEVKAKKLMEDIASRYAAGELLLENLKLARDDACLELGFPVCKSKAKSEAKAATLGQDLGTQQADTAEEAGHSLLETELQPAMAGTSSVLAGGTAAILKDWQAHHFEQARNAQTEAEEPEATPSVAKKPAGAPALRSRDPSTSWSSFFSGPPEFGSFF